MESEAQDCTFKPHRVTETASQKSITFLGEVTMETTGEDLPIVESKNDYVYKGKGRSKSREEQ